MPKIEWKDSSILGNSAFLFEMRVGNDFKLLMWWIAWKVIILLIIGETAVLGVPPVQERKFNLSLGGGWNYLSMDEVNKQLFKDPGTEQQEFKLASGSNIGIGFMCRVVPDFTIGARTGFSLIKDDYIVDDPPGHFGELEASFYLTAIEIGGDCCWFSTNKLDLTGGLFMGWGLGNFIYKASWHCTGAIPSLLSPGIENAKTSPARWATLDVSAKGSGFCLDSFIGINYKLSARIKWEFKIGYQLALIPEMELTKDVDLRLGDEIVDYPKGTPLKDDEGNNIKFNCNGLGLVTGLRIIF